MTTINDKCVSETTACDLNQTESEITPDQILFDLNEIVCDGFQNNFGVNYTAELVFDFAQQHKGVLVGKEFADLASAKDFVQKAFKGLAQKQVEQQESVSEPTEFFKTSLSVIACMVTVVSGVVPAAISTCGTAALNVYDYVNE